jgi:hypothetical protein
MSIFQTYFVSQGKTIGMLCIGFLLSSHAYSQCACKDNMAHIPNASFTQMMVEDDLHEPQLA